MEVTASTDGLRKMAANWSLAGDDQLLTLLQHTHERLVARCQEINRSLDKMASALDDASISLQNVNNRFMGLSNIQFIESRVYDDDTDVCAPAPTAPAKEPLSSLDEVSILRKTISVLESTHEPVTIVDSDSWSSDDEDTPRVVLKPKDVYSDRPLPYIIGSLAWRSKWHAGLVNSDSESESDRQSELYSEGEEANETEDTPSLLLPVPRARDEVSDSISSRSPSPSPAPARPSDVAAELARRLGGGLPPQKPDRELSTSSLSEPRPLYKPQQPTAATVFPDEPPIVVYSDDSYEEEDDIFAELHNSKPYSQPNKVQSNVTEALFDFDKEKEGDIFSDFADHKVQPQQSITQRPNQYNEEVEPKLFTEKPTNKAIVENENIADDDRSVKKPVGGISLFGNNKGAESIGAAILKRNQLKSSTSGEDSGTDEPITKPTNQSTAKKEKDIFDDLFAKSEKLQKKNEERVDKKEIPIKKVENVVKKEEKKVDLFSDNIFDDIDDIFTSSVVKMPSKEAKANQKSLFDDDNDDLFADIAVSKSTKPVQNKNEKKVLFDSDDDLFSEKTAPIKNETGKPKEELTPQNLGIKNSIPTENLKENTKVESKSEPEVPKTISIFDDNSDDDIFTDIKTTKSVKDVNINSAKGDILKVAETKVISSPLLFDDEDDDLFSHSKSTESSSKRNLEKPKTSPKLSTQSKESLNNALDSYNKSQSKINEVDSEIKQYKDQERGNKQELLKEDSFKDKPIEYKLPDNITSIIEQDDFSLPKQESEQVIDSKIIKQVTEVKDALISEPQETISISDKPKFSINEIKKDDIFQAQEEISNTSQIFIDFEGDNVKQNTTLSPEAQSSKHAIFDDIFSEPPAFQKPAEPKKSRNVNALFDDDSDDDTLFFKKNDVISDEKPDDFAESSISFGLFNDEPPAIDVDFETKPSKINDLPIPSFALPDIYHIEVKTVPNESQEKNKSLILKDEIKDVTSNVSSIENVCENPEKPKKLSISELLTKENEKESFSSFGNEKEWNANTDKSNDDNTQHKTDVEQNLCNSNLYEDTLSDEDLFKMPKSKEPVVPKLNSSSQNITKAEEDLFKTPSNDIVINRSQNISKEIDIAQNKSQTHNSEQDKSKHKSNSDLDISKSESEKTQTSKTIGKLNTKNLNINVNALLPGSSPKKVKDQTDGQTISITNEDTAETSTEKFEKTMSFDKKPESGVLDNKLSKERPKIQVKRRPSTRRARLEAARKSMADFGDSTDSSSFDDGNKSRPKSSYVSTLKLSQDSETFLKDETLDSTLNINKTTLNQSKTTKVVYVLNDEDIFNTKSETQKPILEIVDDSSVKSSGINTLGKAYSEIQNEPKTSSDKSKIDTEITTSDENPKSSAKVSIFDDLSDDEDLFNKSQKKTKVVPVKNNLFDSGSDEDLFSGNAKTKTAKESKDAGKEERQLEVQKKPVKASLFGDDDDDDDDLFGVARKERTDIKPTTSLATPPRETLMSKPAEPVFEDPLSMLGDDD